ncbi:MAG: hypothetical protein VKP72_00045 [bacterium]|nr:hypothetical protein [bacterium]
MSLLEQTGKLLANLTGAQPDSTSDWAVVQAHLEDELGSVIVEFDRPGGQPGDRLMWTLRDLDEGRIRFHDPAQDPLDVTVGRVLKTDGLPPRTIVGDGHLLIDVGDMGKLFARGHGKALLPGTPDA